MEFQDQLKLERSIVAAIAIASIIAGFILGHLEVASWTF